MAITNDRKRTATGLALALCSVLALGTSAARADIEIDKSAPSQSKPATPAGPAKQGSTFTPKPPASPQPASKAPKEDK